MKQLLCATALALCTSGLLLGASTASALSMGAQCEDKTAARNAGPFGPLSSTRRERPSPPRWSRSRPARAAWPDYGDGTLGDADRRAHRRYGRPGLHDPDRSERRIPPRPERPRMERPAAPEWAGRDLYRIDPQRRPDWANRGPGIDRFDRERPRRYRGMHPRRAPFPGFYEGAVPGIQHGLSYRAAPPRVMRPGFGPPPSPASDSAPGAPLSSTSEQTPEPVPPAPVEVTADEEQTARAQEPADADGDTVPDTGDLCAGTPSDTAVNAFGCLPSETIPLHGVRFHEDSARLTESAAAVLDGVAATLASHPDLHVEIAGHADSTGDSIRNFDLSTRQALVVMQYLADQGAPVESMIARGYGSNQPMPPDGNDAANRRVELRPVEQGPSPSQP